MEGWTRSFIRGSFGGGRAEQARVRRGIGGTDSKTVAEYIKLAQQKGNIFLAQNVLSV